MLFCIAYSSISLHILSWAWGSIFHFLPLLFFFPIFFNLTFNTELFLFALLFSLLLDNCLPEFIKGNIWLTTSLFLRSQFVLIVIDCYASQLQEPKLGYKFSLAFHTNQVVIEAMRIGSRMSDYASFQLFVKYSYLRCPISVLIFLIHF